MNSVCTHSDAEEFVYLPCIVHMYSMTRGGGGLSLLDAFLGVAEHDGRDGVVLPGDGEAGGSHRLPEPGRHTAY